MNSMKTKLEKIYNYLQNNDFDSYILVDYENKNPLVKELLLGKMLTRKIVISIQKDRKSRLFCHFIDSVFLKIPEIEKNFDVYIYNTWQELLDFEKKYFAIYKKVLMDISRDGLLPRISLADYGSVYFIKELGIEISSSGDLLQEIVSTLSKKSMDLQDEACRLTLKIKDEAFELIRKALSEEKQISEYEVQQFICKRFTEEGMIFDEPPIVAIDKNAANPHYAPSENDFSYIKKGNLILIDMWAKMNDPDAVYADITWMAYAGEEVPEEYQKLFDIVKEARDAAIEFISKEIKHRKVYAFEADDIARKAISSYGYGQYFSHRLGHNIGVDVSPHGNGANLDNYETHDDRYLINNTSFSDEPGIYIPNKVGVRLETDLRIENDQLKVVGGLQKEIIKLY